MKKYFFMFGAFAFVCVAALGAWKYQVHKKLPWLNERTPASATEEMDFHTADEDSDSELSVEQVSNQVAEEVAHEEAHPIKKEEMKIKLVQAKPVKKVAAKPTPKVVAKAEFKPVVKAQKSVLSLGKGDIKHTVTKDETAWFLANVYYGKGQAFETILAANGFSDAKEIREGKEILIPNPKFHKGQSEFAAHYSELWEKRAKALKERDKQVEADKYMSHEPLPTSKVVIPTDEIRAKDSVSQFPFTEVKNPHRSTADEARKVLRQAEEHHGE